MRLPHATAALLVALALAASAPAQCLSPEGRAPGGQCLPPPAWLPAPQFAPVVIYTQPFPVPAYCGLPAPAFPPVIHTGVAWQPAPVWHVPPPVYYYTGGCPGGICPRR
jgi:hypothetical protein